MSLTYLGLNDWNVLANLIPYNPLFMKIDCPFKGALKIDIDVERQFF